MLDLYPFTVFVYLGGVKVGSNEQIAQELAVNDSDVQQMTTQLRQGIVKKKPKVTLADEVECDEAYVVAGHKGYPKAVKNKGRKGRRRRLKGKPGRGTLEKERPPVFGMIQRGGQVVINLLSNVSKRLSSLLSKTPLFLAHLFIRMSTAFILA